MCFPVAQLLRQGDHGGGPEEDRHLLAAAHQRQRGDHLRLQVPPGGQQDPLSVRHGELPRHAQLEPPPLPLPPSSSSLSLLTQNLTFFRPWFAFRSGPPKGSVPRQAPLPPTPAPPVVYTA